MYFFNRCFDKNRLKALILWLLNNTDEDTTLEIVEKLKDLGFQYATKAGLSLSIDDLKIPPRKDWVVSEAGKLVDDTHQEYLRGRITSVESIQQLVDTWHRASEILKKEVIQHFQATDILNPVYMMAFSGARGNISQVRQLVGMRGLMADPQGQIIGFPIRSNFKEGLTVTEYMISCYGARKGLVDTALRTADAGYLTRRLVDVSQHVVVRIPTCATKKGIFLKDIKDSGKVLLSLKDRLIGRVLSADVLSSRSSNVQTEILSSFGQRERGYRQQEETELGTPSLIGFRNQEISPSLATKLAYYHKKILVRSPLTCSAQSGICQMCYGWSLSEGRLVTLGEAVGIVAAQSIGEPGTQLTMRTFHTGGVFSGDVLDEIKAPFPSQVFFNRPLEGVLIRTPHGKIGFLTRNKGQIVCKKIFSRPSSSSLVQGKKGTQEEQGFAPSMAGGGQRAPLAQNGTVAMNRENNWNDKNSENSSYDSSILQQAGETTVFQIERSTILFVRQKENVPKDYLLAESSSLQSQTNERAEAKKIVFSDISGQVFFSQMVVGRMLDKDGQLICSSRDLGSIWILAGQSPETRFFLPFYKKGSHLVNQSTLIGRAHFGSFTFSSSPFDKFSILSPSRAGSGHRTSKKEKFLIPPSSSISSLVKETTYKKERETKVSGKNLFSFKIVNICHIEKLGSFYILSGPSYSDSEKTKEKFFSDTIFFPKNSFLLHGDQNKEKTLNAFSEKIFSDKKNNDFGALLGEKKSFYRIESSPFLSSWKKLKTKLKRRTTLVSIPKMWRNLFFIWFSKRYAFKTGGKAWWESRYYNDFKGGSFLLSESSDFIFNDRYIFLNARSFSFEKSVLKHNYTRKRDSKNFKNSNDSLISPFKTKLFLLGMGTAHYNFDSSSFYENNGFSDFKKRRTFFTPQTFFIAGEKTTKRRWVSKQFPLAFQYNLQGLEKREISLVSGWAVWENNFKNDKIKKEYFLQRKILNRLSQSKTFLFPQVSPSLPRFSSVRTYISSLPEGGKYRQQREKDHLTPVPVFLNSKSKTEKNFSITFGTKTKKKKKEWKRNPFQIESLKKFEEFEKFKAVCKSSKVFLASFASEDAPSRSSLPGKYEGVANESLLEKKLFDVPIKSFLFKQKKKDVLEKSLFWRNCFLSKIPSFPVRDEREASTTLLKPKNPFHKKKFYEKSFRDVTPFLNGFENLNLVFKSPEKTNLSSKKLVSLCFPPYPNDPLKRVRGGDKRKIQKNRVSIKPGWIYIPKTSYRAVKLHKSYKLIGTGYWEGVEKSNFDPWTVQVECLPRIFPCSKIFCKDIKDPHFSNFFNLNLQTLPIGYGCEIRPSTNILEKNGKQFFSLAKESTTIKLSEIRISLWLQSFISFYSKKMCSKTFKILEPVIWKTLLKNIFLKRLIKSRLSIQLLSNLKSRFSFLNENIQNTSSGDNFEIYLNSKEQKNKSGILFLLVADQIRDASHFSSFGEQRRGSMATPSKAGGGPRTPSYFPGEEERGRASTDGRGGKNFQFQCVQAFDKRKRDQNKISFSHPFLLLVRKIKITPLLSIKDEKRRFSKLGKAETFSQNLYKRKKPFPNFTENTFSNEKLKCQQFPSKLSRLASLILTPSRAGSGLRTPNPKINKKSNCAGRDLSLSSILYEQKVKWKPFSSLCCLYPQENMYVRTLEERKQGQGTKIRKLKRSGNKFYKISTPLRKPSKYSRSSFFHSIFPDANYFLTSIKSFNAISTDQYKIFGRWKKFYKRKKPSNGISILDIKVLKFSSLSPKDNGLISQSKDFLEQTQRENLKNFPKIDKSVLMETPILVNGHQNGFPLKDYSIKSFFPSRKQTKNNKKSKFSIGKTKLSKFSIQHTNLGQFLIPKRKTIFYFYKALNLIKFIVYWDESTKKIPDGLKPNFKTSFQIGSHSGKVNLYFDFIPLEEFSSKTGVRWPPPAYEGASSFFSIKTSPFSALVTYKTEEKKEKGPTESLLSKDEGEILCKNSQTGLLASKETKTHALLTYERTSPFYPKEEGKDSKEVPLHTSLYTQSAKGTSEAMDLPMQEVEKFQNLNRKKSSCGPVLTKEDQYNLSIEQEKPIVSIGQLLHYGEEIASNIATAQPGQIIAIDKNKVSIRKGQAVLFYSGGVNHVSHGQFVPKNSPLLTLTYKKLITGDIVQGIPKIEQFFEAPVTKDGEPLSESLGLKLQQAFHRLRGSLSLPLAARQSVAEIQEFVVEGIQKVYLSQGVLISDKHIEIIVRQMTSKGKIIDGGNTGLLPGEYISLQRIESINLSTQGRRADYEPAILGITQASLDSESFISAASFQETTRVLSRDSLEGKTDFLRGLKERVVLGDLIQAGTGLDENLTYGLVMKEEKEKNSLMKFENKKNYDERRMPSAFFQDRKGFMNSKKAEVDHLENWIFGGRYSPEISPDGSDFDESEKLENYKFSDSIYNSFQSEGVRRPPPAYEGDAPRSSSFGGQQGVFEIGSDIYGINDSEWSSFLRNEKNDEKI